MLDFDDIDAVAEAFAGQDAVVHMHAKSNHDTDELEPYLQPNVVGVYNAYEAARRAGVKRFVFASSNHATGWYELVGERCDAESTPRPDGMYGVAKGLGRGGGPLLRGSLRAGGRLPAHRQLQVPPEAAGVGQRRAHPLHLAERPGPGQPGAPVGGGARHSVGHLLWDFGQRARLLGHHQCRHRAGLPPQDNAEDYADEVLAKGGEYNLWGYTTEGMV